MGNPMLYDKRWQTNTVESLIWWLEQQPAKSRYIYEDRDNCLLCQYYKAHGIDAGSMSASNYWVDRQEYQLPEHFNDVAIAGRKTFGAALQRARVIHEHKDGTP